MSKKIDIKRTLGKPVPPLSIDAIEEMTRLIHDKKPVISEKNPIATVTQNNTFVKEKTPIALKTAQKTYTEKTEKEVNYEKTTEKVEKSKAGRKPKLIYEPERLIRVSVDLPESVFIQLKVAVIQQKTDMKTYIRKMVEKDMEKLNKKSD